VTRWSPDATRVGPPEWSPPRRWRSHLAGSAHGIAWALDRLGLQLFGVVLARIGRLDHTVRLPDGRTVSLPRGSLAPIAQLYYRDVLVEHGSRIEPDGPDSWIIRLPDGVILHAPVDRLFPVVEIFLDQVYAVPMLEWEDKFVVDAGTSIGDSTIFFAHKGARVVGIEPDPRSREYALRNVDANGLTGKIEMVGKKLVSRAGTSVDSITLEGILESSGRSTIDLLKLDCDGCEPDVILYSEPATLNRVQRIVVEYDDPPRQLCGRLESLGFRLRRFGSRSNGYIYAERAERR
jgi:Methyltransferase FkbM domain